jgi:acyl-CoA hydrolase
MDYQAEYASKLTSVDAVLDSIQSNSVLTASQAANEPTAIFDRLHELYGRVRNVRMYGPMCCFEHPFMMDPKYRDIFDVDVAFLMENTRRALASDSINYFPSHMHDGGQRWLAAHGAPDLFICAVSPMDKHGYFTIPLCLAHERTFFNAAKRVVVQVNPNLPRTRGDTAIHISQVDMIVEQASPLPYLPKSQPNEVERAIGGYVSTLVEDGDCIQLGIGGIPDAAAMSLMDKHDLGLHTEMLTNSILDLMEAGVLTNRRKNFHPNRCICTFALGTQELYDMVDDNPGVEFYSGSYVNDPRIIGRNDHFISINSGLAVDLTGQVCSESIGSRQYSGSGGQSDFAEGASYSNGGRSVICVKATKKNGTISSIVSQHSPGSVVTLSRNTVDYVVSEFGIAPIRGRSVRQRIDNLIAIAHPDFRAQLRAEADALHLW